MKYWPLFCFLYTSLLLAGCETQEKPLNFSVTIHNAEKAYQGTTFFVDKYADPDKIYEVDMEGNVVWSLNIPKDYAGEQIEAELLPIDTVLVVAVNRKLFEIDRQGNILWSHDDEKISHDADRLSNGNTIYVYGMGDQKTDAQVKEITPQGELVWEWYAKDYFNHEPYSEISPKENSGWCHTNSVTRLDGGNTLISLRNFNMIVEVDQSGDIVNTIQDIAESPHDPEVLTNGHILAAHQTATYHAAMEINPETNEVLWEYGFTNMKDFPVRDVNRLPNGNILITCSTRIIEVTHDKEIVWQLELTKDILEPGGSATLGFYKAERISPSKS